MFNAESSELFELLKNNLHYNVKGILLKKVSSECGFTLASAVKDTYEKAGGDMSIYRDENIESAVNLLIPFIIEMTQLLKGLHFERELDEDQCDKNLRDVESMSKELEQEYLKQKHLPPNLSSKQLEGFVNGFPHTADKIILAQSITHKNTNLNFEVFIASKDTNFFSPRGDSKTVTKRIQKKFEIICDHPREIIKIIKDGA